MKTKYQETKAVIIDCLSQMQIVGADDILSIPPVVYDKKKEIYAQHNTIVQSKREQWKCNDELEFCEIAWILDYLFSIVMISLNENIASRDGCELYVRVNPLLIKLMPYLSNDMDVYKPADGIIKELAHMLNLSIKDSECEEIIKCLRYTAPVVMRTLDKNLVPVKNGVFLYDSKQLRPYSEEDIFISKSKVDYIPNATNPIINNPDGTIWDVESWMLELAAGDKELCNTLWEIIGALLRPFVSWNKSAWLYSEKGNNGKGSLCELLRNILGEGSYCCIPLDQMGDAFALESLIYASAIIVDENDVGAYIDRAANLKAIITQDVISVNRKFKTIIPVRFRGFMVQCLNSYPSFKDHSDSLYRRQLFIPMKACFTGVEKKYIKNDYLRRTDVLEYVLCRVLNMNYDSLSEPLACKEALRDYTEMNDPVVNFWNDIKHEVRWNFLPFTFLYDLYKAWFSYNKPSGTVLGKTTFMIRMEQIIANDTDWICKGRKNQIPVKKNSMEGPEPLIGQYNLTNWMNPSFRGANKAILYTPELKSKYSGIERLIPVTNKDVL